MIEINFLNESDNFVKELDYKKRKIRSARIFLLHTLKILENGKDCEILFRNLSDFFGEKVKTIISQNKKGVLEEFLFDWELN